MRAADVLGRVTLVTGKEEFLNERTVAAVRDGGPRPRRRGRALRDRRRRARRWPTLGELSARRRCSPRSDASWSAALENLPEESVDGLLAYAAEPAEDVALVLVHGGGPKGSGVLTKLRKLPAVTEVEVERAQGVGDPGVRRPPRSAATAPRSTRRPPTCLVQAVGQDLRSLAAAADQLANDFPRRDADASTR